MYIKEVSIISPQNTYNGEFEKGDFQIHYKTTLNAIEPSYTEFVPINLLRRMGRAVKIGIGAGVPLIKKYPNINGIIIGTANGGLEDCIKFLNQIVDYEEGLLTPTNFVNSTPNAIAGQLALMGDITGYNTTHTNGSLAFDNAVLDARLVMENETQHIELLIGAIEEISDYNYNIDKLNKHYKEENITNAELIQSNTNGSLCGEGAAMFVVSNQSENALAEIVDQFQICFPEKEELYTLLTDFLQKNKFQLNDIDVLLFGNSGDGRTDNWYNDLQTNLFPQKKITTFKQFCGDYRTASAFGTYIAVKLLEGSHNIFGLEKNNPKTILLYNQFEAERHGFILLKSTNS